MNSSLLLVAVIFTIVRAQTIDECLKNDSITCIQKTLFKKAKEFFNKDSLEIISGVSLVKGQNSRTSRTGKDLIYEQQIEKADSVVTRQDALEKFLGDEVKDFVQGRSLKINFIPIIDKIGTTARAVNELIPAEIRQAADDVVEGRGKKKFMKHLWPVLYAKFGILAAMSYFAIALLAKKAIIAALISLAITIFHVKHHHHHKPEKHEHHEHHDHHEHHEHHKKHDDHHHHGSSLSSSWSAPGPAWTAGGAWDDGAYAAQTQAYSAYNR